VTLRLDYLSPLPPVRSGISDYSVDLLPHLAAHADVRVLRLPGQPIEPELEARWRPAPAELAGQGGRIPLYHMGNNRYHEGVWNLARERPGVVVLHDLVLHHFLLDRTVGRGQFEPYREGLERDHGWIGRAAALPVRWGAFGTAAQFALPANRSLLRRQRGVAVHGRWAAGVLAEDDPELAIAVVPMGIPLPPAASAGLGLRFRRAWRIPESAPLIGSFGFQTPIKRTEVAVRALARPELARVRLLIAGEPSPYANYEKLAAELGVGDRVFVTRFLPFAEMEAAIAATDLCLNLRYPTAGETSASLLRILAVGRPVVVSDYGEFGELPDEVAVRVRLGEGEEESFALRLAELLSGGRETLARMGANARRHVAERHDPERAAQALVAAVTSLAGREPPGDSPPRVEPASSAFHFEGAGEIRVEGLEGWRAGGRARLGVVVRNRGRERWLPSHEVPGGVIFEVQLREGAVDLYAGRPWLALEREVAPGEERRFELELRRPLARGRLLIKPTVALTLGNRPFGRWDFEVEL
jgi:glycosyltransferase involved in cell wall biosynthesis